MAAEGGGKEVTTFLANEPPLRSRPPTILLQIATAKVISTHNFELPGLFESDSKIGLFTLVAIYIFSKLHDNNLSLIFIKEIITN